MSFSKLEKLAKELRSWKRYSRQRSDRHFSNLRRSRYHRKESELKIIQDGLKYFATSYLAKESGYEQDHICLLIRQGKVKGIKSGKRWFALPESLREYKNRAEKQKRINALKSNNIPRRLKPAELVQPGIAPSTALSQTADKRVVKAYFRSAFKTGLKYALPALFVFLVTSSIFALSKNDALKNSFKNLSGTVAALSGEFIETLTPHFKFDYKNKELTFDFGNEKFLNFKDVQNKFDIALYDFQALSQSLSANIFDQYIHPVLSPVTSLIGRFLGSITKDVADVTQFEKQIAELKKEVEEAKLEIQGNKKNVVENIKEAARVKEKEIITQTIQPGREKQLITEKRVITIPSNIETRILAVEQYIKDGEKRYSEIELALSSMNDRFSYTPTILIPSSSGNTGHQGVTILNPATTESETVRVSNLLDVSGDAIISRSLNVDSGTFYVNPTDNRVGINTTSLETALEVVGTASISGNLIVGGTSISSGDSVFSNNVSVSGNFEVGANKLYVNSTTGRVGIGTQELATIFEVQGTASASYFLTGNSLQVGGYASAAYSRFGTNTTGYSSFLNSTSDLLVSGDLELDGSAFFDSNASVAGNFELTGAVPLFGINAGNVINNTFEVGGTASISGNVSLGAKASISSNLQISGRFIADTPASHSFAGDLNITDDLTIAGDFNLTGDQTISGNLAVNGTGSSSFAGSLSVAKGLRITGNITNDALTASRLISTNANKVLTSVSSLTSWIVGTTNQITVSDDGDGTATLSLPQDIHTSATPQFAKLGLGTVPTTILEVQGTASASYLLTGNTLQVGGFASAAYSRFGTSTTGHANYISTANDLLISGDLEVRGTSSFGGVASVSGNFFTYGTNTFSGTGSSSFAGSLSVAKGFLAGANNALVVNANATANTLNIVGGNVGIGTTGPGFKLDVSGQGRFSTTGISTPAILFSGDSASGIYRTTDATEGWGFGNGGVSRFHVQVAGNVGIGTTAPSTTLEVQGTASASYLLTGNTLQVGGFASAAYSRFGTGTTSEAHYITGANDLFITGDLEVDGSVSFAGPASISNTLYVSTLGKTGNVGIGTTGPNYKLEVIGTGRISSTLQVGDTIDAYGRITIGFNNDGLATSPHYSFNGDTNTGMYSPAADTLAFSTASTERLKIQSDGDIEIMNGNVGIGTTTPSSLLTVQGRGEIQGTASASYLLTGNTLQVGGFASAAYSRFGTVATTHALSASNDVLINGKLEVDGQVFFDSGFVITGASSSGNFDPAVDNQYDLGDPNYRWRTGYFGTSIGINNGGSLDTTLEVGGTASISDNVYFGSKASISNNLQISGRFIADTSASHSFAGDLTISKEFISSGASSNSFAGSLLVSKGLNAQAIVGTGLTINGNASITGNTILGDASGDTLTANADAWTFVNDTNFALSGGVNGLSFDTNTFSVDAANNRIGILTITPSTTFEVQGTASASYLLTGNTLQIGGFASAAYSRFGTSTLTTNPAGNWITGSNDLLISGDLYGVGSIAFAGPASISNTLFVGTGGKTGNVGIGTTRPGQKLEVVGTTKLINPAGNTHIIFNDSTNSKVAYLNYANEQIQLYNNAAAEKIRFDLGGPSFFNTGGNVGIGTTTPSSLLTVQGRGEFQGTASASYLLTGNTLQVGGFASAAYSRFGTSTTGHSNYISTTNDVLVSGDLEVRGTSSFGGVASVSGNFFTYGANTFSGTGSSSFAGSLSVAKGFAAGANNALVVNGAATANTLNIVGGNVGIGTTGPLAKLNIVDSGGLPVLVSRQGGNDGLYFDSGSTNAHYNWLVASQYNVGAALEITPSTATGGTTFSTPTAVFTQSGNVGIGTTSPTSLLTVQGRGEIQGTASASYLLTGNTLQVGGFASAAYNRFGTVATTHGLSATNDVLINGNLEVDGSTYFDGTVNFTTIASASLFYAQPGSASSPSFSFAIDQDTGMFRSAVNQLGFSTLGIERMRINDSGNVGINFGGNIDTKFEVGGAASISGALTTYNTNTFSGTGSSSFAGSLSVAKGFTAGANNALVVNGSATANTLNIVGGNVGIGTTGPTAVFHIYSSDGEIRITRNNTGNVGMGQIYLSGKDSASNLQDYALIGAKALDSTSGAEDGAFAVETVNNGSFTERLRIDNLGNVGIGTTSPANLLDLVVNDANNSSNINLIRAAHTSTSTAANGLGAGILFVGEDNDASSGGVAQSLAQISGIVEDVASTSFDAGLAIQVNKAGTGLFEAVRINSLGNVGIGTTGPTGNLQVHGANRVTDSNTQNVRIMTTDAMAIDKGGTLALGGVYTGTTVYPFAQIAGRKETGVDGNVEGYLQFATPNSGGTFTEKMRITSTGNVGIGTTTPSSLLTVQGRGEVQGTASASYFLTGNTLQVGGFASAAYSRFGTSTTGHANYISTTNDVLVSGDLETRGTVSFGGVASVSGNFFTYGTNTFSGTGSSSFAGSLSVAKGFTAGANNALVVNGAATANTLNIVGGNVGIGTTGPANLLDLVVNDANNSSNINLARLAHTSTSTAANGLGAGLLFVGEDNDASSGGVAQSLALIQGIVEDVASTSFDAGLAIQVNKAGTGLFEAVRVNSLGNLGIGTTTPSSLLTVQGRGEFQGTASASYLLTGNTLQVGGFASAAYSRFGTSTTGHANYISTTNDVLVSGDLETRGTVSFGGVASVSGNFFTYGTNTFSGTGSSSFAGSLSVAKGFTAGANNALVVNGSATANTLNIVGGNVGIGTTGPANLLDLVVNDANNSSNVNLVRIAHTSTSTAANGLGAGLLFVGEDNDASSGGVAQSLALVQGIVEDVASTSFDAGLAIQVNKAGTGLFEAVRVNSLGNLGIGTTTPSSLLTVQGRGEFQGTASASYLLTGNTLQVGGFASAAYSRFGTGTTSEAHYITGSSDLFITGDLEVDGSVSFAGPASISNTLYVSTLGNTGNVGIGTTGPATKLHVVGTQQDALQELARFGANDAAGNAKNLNIKLNAGTPEVIIRTGAAGTDPRLSFAVGTDTAQVTLTVSGNVGIGTTTPSSLLTVQGRGEFQGTASASYLLTGNTLQVGGYASAAYSRFGTNTTSYSRLSDTNDLLITDDLEVDGTTWFDGTVNFSGISSSSLFYAQPGTAASPSFAFAIDQDTGMFRRAVNALGFSTLGVERLTILSDGNVGIGTTGPVSKLEVSGGRLEVGGTASASYLLTGNTLQVGGFASAAYSRFGTSTLTTNPAGNWITGSNDLLISGDLYGVGSIAFVGPASISNTLFVGTGGKTGNVGIGTTGPARLLSLYGTNPRLAIDSAAVSEPGLELYNAGALKWLLYRPTNTNDFRIYDNVFGTDIMSFKTNTGNVGIGTTGPVSKLEVSGGRLEVGGTASASYLLTGNTLQVGGYASAAYSRFGTSTTGHANYISTTNDVLVSGDLETRGTASFGGVASVSGNFFTYGTNTFSGTGSSSFAGSLSVAKGFTAGANNALVVNGSATANTLNIVGGNVGIGTTGPTFKLQIKSAAVDSNPLRITRSGGTETLFDIYEDASGDGRLILGQSSGATGVQIHTDGDSYFNGGNVGIGTSTLTEKLEIVGTASISGNLLIGGIQQTSGTSSSSFAGPVEFEGTPLGTGISQGTVYLHPATAGVNNVILGVAVGSTEKLRVDAEGDIQIVGLFNSTNTSGTNQLSGNFQVDGNTTLGNATGDTITTTGRFNSDILPSADLTYNLGSSVLRWDNVYFGSASITNLFSGGEASNSFTINTDNATADAEDSYLAFERGTTTPNATIKWDSANDQFVFNYPISTAGSVFGTGTASSSFAGPVWFTATPTGTNLQSGTVYINPGSGAANYTLFGIGVAGVQRFRVDAEGDTAVAGDLGVENQLYDITEDTLRINDDLQINGNDIKDSGTNIRISLGDTTTLTATVTDLTGDLEISGSDIRDSGGTNRVTFSTLGATGLTTATGALTTTTYLKSGDELIVTNAAQFGGTTSVAYNRFGTSTTGHSNYISTTNDVLVSGDLEVRGTSSFGGVASVSGNFFTYGTNTFSGTGSSSFAGSLSVAKGFLAGANNALVVNGSATANTLNIVGGNVGIGTTGPGYKLHVSGDIKTNDLYGGSAFAIVNPTVGANGFFRFMTDTGSGVDERIRITNNGNLGIGDISPEQKLSVVGNILASTSGNVDLILKSTSAVGDDGKFIIRSATTNDRLEIMNGTTPTSLVTIASTGNVGIGTTAPLPLAITANDKGLTIYNNYGNRAGILELIGVSGANFGSGNPTGGITFGNDEGGSVFDELAQIRAYATNSDQDTGALTFYTATNGALAAAMTIDYTGNVGIGTTGPNGKLDVRDGNLVLSDADVAHGMTDLIATTVHGYLAPLSGTEGGLQIVGLSDSGTDAGIMLYSVIGNADPTDTVPAIILRANKKSGTTDQALGALETVLQVRNAGTNLVTVLGNGNVGIGTTTPSSLLTVQGRGEIQGTASASYLLTGNTLQVGGYASAAYSRFGTSTLTTNPAGNWITGSNDLLISGDLYGVGSIAFAGPASISNTLFVGTGGKTGNVGIGTTGPDNNLHVFKADASQTSNANAVITLENSGNTALEILSGATSQGAIYFGDSGDAADGQIVYNHAASPNAYFQFVLNTGEKMRIQGDGNVGIGTTGPGSLLHVSGSGSSSEIRLTKATGDATPGILSVYKARGTVASPTVLSNNDNTLSLIGYGYSGAASNYLNNAQIQFAIDGNPDTASDTTDMPGRIEFYTVPDGSATLAERMRIQNDGNVGIGTTGPINLLDLVVNDANNSSNINLIRAAHTSTSTAANGLGAGILFVGEDNDASSGGVAQSLALVQGIVEDVASTSFDAGLAIQVNKAGTGLFEAVRINSLGNLGIGTTTPTSLLTVQGRGEFQGTASASYLLTGNTLQVGGFASAAYSRFGTSTLTTNPASNWITGSNDLLISGDLYGVGSIAFAGPASISNTLFVGTGGKTGNVGIGTTGPGDKLEVAGSNSNIRLRDTRTSGNVANDQIGGLDFYRDTATSAGLGAAMRFLFHDSGATHIAFTTRNPSDAVAERVRITSTGNVGIGDTSPEQKLSVVGNIMASTSGNVDLILRSSSAVGDDGKFIIRSATTNDRLEIMNGTTPTSLVTIASTGFVGIGTTGPAAKLEVAGNMILNSSGAQIDFRNGGGTSAYFLELANANADLQINDRTGAGAVVFTVKSGGNVGIGTTTPSSLLTVQGRGEFQGTASASYLLTGNTLQVGGFASAAYSRFGTGTTSEAHYITGSNDLFITGDLEVDGSVSFAGPASISNTLYVSTLGKTGNVGIGTTGPANLLDLVVNDANNSSNINLARLAHTSTSTAANGLGAGILFVGEDNDASSGGVAQSLALVQGIVEDVASTSFDAGLAIQVNKAGTGLFEAVRVNSLGNMGIGTTTPSSLLTVQGRGEIQGTASASYFLTGNTLQVGGYSSAAYSRFGTATTGHSNYISTTNDVLVSGDLETRGTASFGGVASVSGNFFTYGTNTFSGTGSSSFAGSLSVAKGFLAGANNALVVNANATANTLNIVGGNVGIGTTGPGYKLQVVGDGTNLVGQFSSGGALGNTINLVRTTASAVQDATVYSFDAYQAGTRVGQEGFYSDAATDSGLFAIWTKATGGSLTERMRITSTGNVGIGTTGPDALLHVGDATTKVTMGKTYTGTGTWSGTRPAVVLNDGTVRASLQTVSSLFVIGTETAHQMKFDTNGVTKMVINSDGNVGIGTTTPANLLDLTVNDANNSSNINLIRIAHTSTSTAANGLASGILFVGEDNDASSGGVAQSLALVQGIVEDVASTSFDAGLAIQVNKAGTGLFEAIRINSLGNLGIGTTTPTSLLTVQGRGEFQGTASASYLLTGNTLQVGGFASAAYSRFGTGTSSELHYITGSNDLFITGDLEVDGSVSFAGPASISNTLYVSTLGKTGNVGIGTTGPGRLLHVYAGSSGATPAANTELVIEDDSDAELAFVSPNTNDARLLFGDPQDDNIGGIIYQHSDNSMALRVNDGTKLFIKSDGNVGIGTTGPAQKLDLVGAFMSADNKTAATAKQAIFLAHQYDSAVETEGFMMMETYADSSVNRIDIGGGHSAYNAATSITFNTAANNSTRTGTERMIIKTDGNVGIGTTSPANLLDLVVNDANNSSNINLIRATHTSTSTAANGLGAGILFVGEDNDASSGGVAQSLALVQGIVEDVASTSFDAGLAIQVNKAGTGLFEAVRVNSLGNLGIGDGTPEEKLTVTGNILASTSGNVDLILRSSSAVGDDGKFIIRSATTNDRLEIMNGTTPTSLVTIASTGNVGIGTTGPNEKFEVVGGATGVQMRLTAASGYGTGIVFYDGTAGAEARNWRIGTANSVAGDFGILSSTVAGGGPTGDPKFTILNSGNVGIGNTTPNSLLDVAGNITASTSGNVDLILRSSSAVGDDGKFIIRSATTNDRLEIMNGTTPTSLVTIASTGNVGIGTTLPDRLLTVQSATDAILSVKSSTTGTSYLLLGDTAGDTVGQISYNNTSNFMAFQTNTTEQVRIDSSGNVGIGTTSPTTKLEVQGTASASYLLTGNTLQVGGFASAAYSRFGTSTLTTNPAGNWITGSNDLLISGDLYGVGSIAFAGPASISNTLFVGTGGKTGFVGIGTAAPARSLEIQVGAGTNEGLRIGRSGAADSPYTDFLLNTTGTPYFSIQPGDSGVYRNLALNPSGGNVGIGNTTPNSLLDVAGNITASTSGNVDLILRSSSAVGDDGKFIIRSATTNDRLEIMNGTTPTSLVTIASTGYVGIGTTGPGAKLDVQDTLANIPTVRIGTTADVSVLDDSVLGQLVFTADDDSATYNRVPTGAIQSIAFANLGVPARWGGGATTGNGAEMAFFVIPQSDASLTEAMRINRSGNVGIGTTAPAAILEVVGNSSPLFNVASGSNSRFYVAEGGNVGIGTTGPLQTLHVAGTARITTSVATTDNRTLCTNSDTGEIEFVNGACGISSLRYKENVRGLNYGLDDLMKLNPVFFNYIKDSLASSDFSMIDDRTKRRIGFIAEEMQGVIPEAVIWQDGQIESIDYANLTALLTKGVQELNNKYASLSMSVNQIQARIDNQSQLAADSGAIFDLDILFNSIVKKFNEAMNIVFEQGLLKITNIIADKLTAKEVAAEKLCVGTTCVTEQELKALLNQNGIQTQLTPAPTPSLTPTPTPNPEPTPISTIEPTPSPTLEATPTPSLEPGSETSGASGSNGEAVTGSSTTGEPTPNPTPELTPTPTPTPELAPEPTLTTVAEPTPAPSLEATPEPTPSPLESPAI